ncbi:hypothetical protein EJ06DRAFT_526491 [Trichodelitschia bisporula]|uniref:DUF1687-domain-containing protein n=1 Tax=Trichodelitschia bisporula TaxID=703511 RepID=A0A6G1I7X9_9PEZI|nr:hypothetical protein EJ06DRAFT_526491 [Trichodelitschia bisporula]
MFRKLFTEHGAKDVITLFHKPNNAASTRTLTLLKQWSANSESTATEDQASQHETQSKTDPQFELDVTEAPPTVDQLKNILEYVGSQNAGSIISGARDTTSALQILKEDSGRFQRPIIVNWHQGKVVVGDDQSQILSLVKALSKDA